MARVRVEGLEETEVVTPLMMLVSASFSAWSRSPWSLVRRVMAAMAGLDSNICCCQVGAVSIPGTFWTAVERTSATAARLVLSVMKGRIRRR